MRHVHPERHPTSLAVAVVLTLAVGLAGCDSAVDPSAAPTSTAVTPSSVESSGAQVEPDDTPLTITTSTGTRPFPRITGDDRTQILTTLAVDRATGRNGLGPGDTYDAVYLIDTVGQVDDTQGDVRFESDAATLTPSERAAIATALAPLAVTFVDAAWSDTPTNVDRLHSERAALIGLAAPQVAGRQVQISSFVLCGSVCGSGSLDILERGPDGTWRITGTRIDWEA